MRQRARVFYSGTVQGVGFRWRAVDASHRLAVTGFVRNLPDGRVELVAEGERTEIEKLLTDVRARLAGLIEDEETAWSAASGEFETFGVAR